MIVGSNTRSNWKEVSPAVLAIDIGMVKTSPTWAVSEPAVSTGVATAPEVLGSARVAERKAVSTRAKRPDHAVILFSHERPLGREIHPDARPRAVPVYSRP